MGFNGGGNNMTRIKKGASCETIGELKKALAGIPDDTKFATMGNECKYVIEIWKIHKSWERAVYEDEKRNAEYEGRKPDFLRVSISEDEEEM
jgi:hypothetical protein